MAIPVGRHRHKSYLWPSQTSLQSQTLPFLERSEPILTACQGASFRLARSTGSTLVEHPLALLFGTPPVANTALLTREMVSAATYAWKRPRSTSSTVGNQTGNQTLPRPTGSPIVVLACVQVPFLYRDWLHARSALWSQELNRLGLSLTLAGMDETMGYSGPRF